MNINQTWKVAVIASFIAAFVIATIEYFIFSGGTIYIAQVEWQIIDAMPYGKAQEYLAERVSRISNWQSVINKTAYEEFWYRYIYEFGVYFVLALAACLLFIRLQQFSRLLNSTPQGGAN